MAQVSILTLHQREKRVLKYQLRSIPELGQITRNMESESRTISASVIIMATGKTVKSMERAS